MDKLVAKPVHRNPLIDDDPHETLENAQHVIQYLQFSITGGRLDGADVSIGISLIFDSVLQALESIEGTVKS